MDDDDHCQFYFNQLVPVASKIERDETSATTKTNISVEGFVFRKFFVLELINLQLSDVRSLFESERNRILNVFRA